MSVQPNVGCVTLHLNAAAAVALAGVAMAAGPVAGPD
jgi:hypothetical protein